MNRRTFLTGLGALTVAPALPALSHGEYAGEGLLLPYQRVILGWVGSQDSHLERWLKLYPDAVSFNGSLVNHHGIDGNDFSGGVLNIPASYSNQLGEVLRATNEGERHGTLSH